VLRGLLRAVENAVEDALEIVGDLFLSATYPFCPRFDAYSNHRKIKQLADM
jgi:hypothetical protein